MKLLEFIPIKMSLLLILGILIGDFLEPNVWIPFGLIITSTALLGAIFYKRASRVLLFGIGTSLAVMAVGMFSVTQENAQGKPTHYTKHATLAAHYWHLKVEKVLKPNRYSQNYLVRCIAIDSLRTSGRLLLKQQLEQDKDALEVDDELRVFGSINSIKPPPNPHQFSYQAYLANFGVHHSLYISSTNFIRAVRSTKTLKGTAWKTRASIISKLEKTSFDPEVLAVLKALLLGERTDITPEQFSNYRNAGALHILAISGLHIGIILIILQFVLNPLKYLPNGSVLQLILVVLILWGFAFVSGLSASVIRAVSMFSFLAYAQYLNRPSNTFNIIALSLLFVLLVFSPRLLFQVGFQMSYAAVLAIIWIYPSLLRFWCPKNPIIQKIWQLISVSLAAQIGVLPISLFYFHQFPGLFLISNLIIVPFLGLILALGIIAIILSLLNHLPDALVLGVNSIVGLMNNLIGRIAKQEAFVFKNIYSDEVFLVLSYFSIFCLFSVFRRPAPKNLLLLLFSFLVMQSWWVFLKVEWAKKDSVTIMHQPQNTAIFRQIGGRLFVYSQDSTKVSGQVDLYRTFEGVESVRHHPLMNHFIFQNKLVLVVDSLPYTVPKERQVDVLLLSKSPKIHLERLLKDIKPRLIIADGSNYYSDVNRWRKTCAQKKLPFHHTGQEGAYYFDVSDD